MTKIKIDPKREQRIDFEIVADACGSEERAMGWYYYLEEALPFPFKARCITIDDTSPLEPGDEVEVLSMAGEENCEEDMLGMIRYQGRKLAGPLSQLEILKENKRGLQALEDWRYWLARGYEF